MEKLYGFCLSIAYISHRRHPYIESNTLCFSDSWTIYSLCSFLHKANTIPITMCFLFTCLWVWLMLRLSPTHYHDPSMTTITGESPETVRFACRVMLDSYAVVAVDWKNSNRLRLKTWGIYRVHPHRLYSWISAVYRSTQFWMVVSILCAIKALDC